MFIHVFSTSNYSSWGLKTNKRHWGAPHSSDGSSSLPWKQAIHSHSCSINGSIGQDLRFSTESGQMKVHNEIYNYTYIIIYIYNVHIQYLVKALSCLRQHFVVSSRCAMRKMWHNHWNGVVIWYDLYSTTHRHAGILNMANISCIKLYPFAP